MNPTELRQFHQKTREAIAAAVKARNIAINNLTEEQVCEAFRQAISCGDFRRYLRVDNHAQKVVYIPYAREQELEGKVASLSKIAKAADALEAWLGKNAGLTADWPVDIKVDNEGDAATLTGLLTDLSHALEPYRERKQAL